MKKTRMHKKDLELEAHRPVSKRASFDFEIGTLTQSPCRGCPMQAMLPDCREDCETLAQIQAILADTISCGHGVLSAETFSLSLDEHIEVV